MIGDASAEVSFDTQGTAQGVASNPSSAGQTVGTAAGAAAGAAAGSVILPGIGTAVGGVIGGAIGGSAGSWLQSTFGSGPCGDPKPGNWSDWCAQNQPQGGPGPADCFQSWGWGDCPAVNDAPSVLAQPPGVTVSPFVPVSMFGRLVAGGQPQAQGGIANRLTAPAQVKTTPTLSGSMPTSKLVPSFGRISMKAPAPSSAVAVTGSASVSPLEVGLGLLAAGGLFIAWRKGMLK